MKQNKQFFDELEGRWGDVIADTYKQANSVDTTIKFSTEDNYLVDDYLTPSQTKGVRSFTIVNPVFEIMMIDEYNTRSFSSSGGDLTIGIKDYDYIQLDLGNKQLKTQNKLETYELKYNHSGIHIYVTLLPNVKGTFKFFDCWREVGDVKEQRDFYGQLASHNMYMEKYDPKLDELLCKPDLKIGDIIRN